MVLSLIFWRLIVWCLIIWCLVFWCLFFLRLFFCFLIFFLASGIDCVFSKSTVVYANLIFGCFSTYIPCRWLYDLEVNKSKLVE